MNYFFGLELSAEARQTVTGLVHDWKRRLTQYHNAKWYDPADYHITLKFLGDLPEVAQPQLIAAASPVSEAASPFQIGLAGTGMFPNTHYPKVLWAGVMPSLSLENLTTALNSALSGIGLPPEKRLYCPHVTVARCRFSIEGEIWPSANEHLFPQWEVSRFVLMQTLPPEQRAKEGNARYTIVQTFPFGKSQ